MKKCSICKIEKDEDGFNWRDKSKGMRQSCCRECKKIIQKKYYKDNKESYNLVTRKSRNLRKFRALKEIKSYLLCHPCVDCGNDDIRVLYFDHVRYKKFRNVMDMVHEGFGWEKISEEINKCEVRCSNCHMIRTTPFRFGSIV